MTTSKSYEDRIRRLARKMRLEVRKSRQRKDVPNSENYGRYMLVDTRVDPRQGTPRIIVGARFGASLEEIEVALRDEMRGVKPFIAWPPIKRMRITTK
jgi:hypothetical protein